nr:DMT family transporter [Insolitispirillum peregrinum]
MEAFVSSASPTASPAWYLSLMPLLFVLLWSTGFIGAKFGLPYAEPLTFLEVRYLLLVVLLVPFAILSRARWPNWRLAGHIAVSGVLVHAIYLGGVFLAIAHGLSAGLTSLVVGLQPLLTAVAVGPFLGERVSGRQWIGFLLGLCGVVLVVLEKLLAANHVGLSWSGFALAAASLLAMTVGTLYQKKFCSGMELRTGTAIQYLAAAAVNGVAALSLETMEIHWSHEFIFAVLWLVFVLSIGAISLLMVMIRRGAVAQVASFLYMVPPVTALIAWGLFDERLGLMALGGMAVAMAGVALVVRR